MAVPTHEELKAPALQIFNDGKEHSLTELFGTLGDYFHVTEAERNERLPSGRQSRFLYRLYWCCYDLYRAGLLTRPRKGVYLITDVGRQVAGKKLDFIDRKYLMQFPSFAEFQNKTHANGNEQESVPHKATSTQTPEESLESAYQTLSLALRDELLETVLKMDPYRFEELVVDLLLAMGYGGTREEAAQVTQKSGDEGIDGIINEDRLGLDSIYIQAKRWQNTVGRVEIQSFVGALAGKQAHKGVFITTSSFNQNAIDYARSIAQKVILIDGERLAELMIEHNVGVSPSKTFTLKKVDSDYFEES